MNITIHKAFFAKMLLFFTKKSGVFAGFITLYREIVSFGGII